MGGTVPFRKGLKIGGMSANALNRTFDAATRPRVHPMIHSERPPAMPANNIIIGVNRTGRFLQTGDVVRVNKVISSPHTLGEDLYFEFDLPSYESLTVDMYGGETALGDIAPSLAVVRCGGDSGDPVYASVYGRELVRISIDDLEHRYANIEENSTILKSCEYGPFMLLGMPSTRWIDYWPVVFPSGGMVMPVTGDKEGGNASGDQGGGDGDIIDDFYFGYSLGVVTGAGTDTNMVKVRRIDMLRSKENRIVLEAEEIDAYVWPETFSYNIQ